MGTFGSFVRWWIVIVGLPTLGLSLLLLKGFGVTDVLPHVLLGATIGIFGTAICMVKSNFP